MSAGLLAALLLFGYVFPLFPEDTWMYRVGARFIVAMRF